MASDSQIGPQFPWGYFLAALLPTMLIVAGFVLPTILEPRDAMGPAMACSLLIGPVGGLVVGWGAFRLWRGDGARFPALRWLVWLPAIIGIAGFALG